MGTPAHTEGVPRSSSRRAAALLVALAALAAPTAGVVGAPGVAGADGLPTTGGAVLLADAALTGGGRSVSPTVLVGDDAGRALVGAVVTAPGGATSGALLRVLPSGALDPAFAGGAPLALASAPRAVAPLLDGRYLVAVDSGLVRVTAAGAVDATFAPPALGVDTVYDLVPLPDGRTLVVGTDAVVAVDAAGRPDGGFAAAAALDGAGVGAIGTVGVAADGRVLVVASAAADGSDLCRVVALDGRGQRDAGYGAGGVATPAVGGVPLGACAAVVGSDGAVAAGWFADDGLTSVVSVLDPSGAPAWQRTDRAVDAVGAHRTAFDGAGRLVEAAAEVAGGVTVRRLTRTGNDDVSFGAAGFTALVRAEALTEPLVHVADGGGVLLVGDAFDGGTSAHTGLWFAALDGPAGTGPEPPLRTTTRFVPLAPVRLLDTRTGLGAPAARPGFGGVVDLQVGGAAGIPADAVAVVLNVTATDSAGPGFVTAWPSGGRLPLVSNLNLERAGQTVANLVTVPLGAGGRVSIYTLAPTHLLADAAGYYEAATTARAGRFVPAASPTRLLDTRTGVGAPAALPGAGAVVDLQVTGNGPVPATGVSAVVLNVTGVDAPAVGYVTVWPAGAPRPLASNLNLAAGDVRPNLVVVPVGAGGRVSLFTQSGTHLLADVTGWFTDATADDAVSGLFVPVPPRRMLDTRLLPGTPVGAGGAVARRIAGTPVVPPGLAGAVVANVTITEPNAPGYVTAWPATGARPLASNLNVVRGQTVANLTMIGLGGGGMALYTQSSAHLLVDVAGWFVA